MATTIILRRPTDNDQHPAIAHIGHPGNQHGLCGTRTIGIPANPNAPRCKDCELLWQQMSWLQRHRYKGQP